MALVTIMTHSLLPGQLIIMTHVTHCPRTRDPGLMDVCPHTGNICAVNQCYLWKISSVFQVQCEMDHQATAADRAGAGAGAGAGVLTDMGRCCHSPGH